MPNDFPHISDTAFPILDNVNPYKYENAFDYYQYDNMQMKITVCKVPWDVGLIHVGNAQIGGLGNVVKFESKEARDEWFAGLEDVYTWHTKYRKYHTDGFIEVPLPYEKCVLYNYVHIEFEPLPVEYADGGKEHFFFFIRSCESLAPNCCKVEILRDTWQTFIYDIDITYMMLERGHAPMSVIDADTYLANPIENNSYLLADDVNYGSTYVSRRANEIVLNSGEMWACIVTSADLSRSFGSFQTTAITPDGQAMQDGQPAMFAYAIAPGSLYAFLTSAKTQVPQFMQTVKAVFFVKREFVQVAGYVTFAGYQLGRLNQDTETINLIDLNKSIFGYAEDYEDIAKLYTYPYAYLEISDETGTVNHVRIEETTGDISLTVTTSLAYPWLCLDGRLSGIGAGGNTVTFSNVNGHSFEFAGDWFNYLNRWDIPTFAVNVDAATVYDYETYYDREQRALENTSAYNNALANAQVQKVNADASADTAYANANRSATTSKTNADARDNTSKTNADNTAATNKGNADRSANTTYRNEINDAGTVKSNADRLVDVAYHNTMNIASTTLANSQRNASAARTTSDEAATTDRTNFTNNRNLAVDYFNLMHRSNYYPQYAYHGLEGGHSWINRVKLLDDLEQDDYLQYYITGAENAAFASTTMINGIGSAAEATIGGTISGGMVGGAPGAVGGAITGVVGAGISLATATASIPVIQNTSINIVRTTREVSANKTANAYEYTENLCGLHDRYDLDKLNAENRWLGICADNSKNTANRAAERAYNTSNTNSTANYNCDSANASRTRNAGITNNANSYNTASTNASNQLNASLANNTSAYNAATTNNGNTLRVELASNTRDYNTATSNANATRETALANNTRTLNAATTIANRNLATANAAIENDVKQAGLKAPVQFGEFANGETSTTRPIGLFCNVVTQAKDAIEQAGDYFLRFGYAVNRAWRFTTFNLMPHFTYWKCSDIWVHSNNVPDAYMDEIRFFLLGGVCVWNDPDDIGVISIYDN